MESTFFHFCATHETEKKGRLKFPGLLDQEEVPGSGVPAKEEADAELDALSGVVRQPASARRWGRIPSRSAISTWSAGWM